MTPSTRRATTLALLAAEWGVDAVATNNVHYATPAGFRLATTVAAIRARRPLAELVAPFGPGRLPARDGRATSPLRPLARRGRALGELGLACAFDLRLVAPGCADFPTPPGLDEQGYLRQLVTEGALERYGPPHDERVGARGVEADRPRASRSSAAWGSPGYFLVVWDIAQVCRRLNIYCQGRGSAANSAVCYALFGVTNVDAVDLGLLFERFLSPARDGPAGHRR